MSNEKGNEKISEKTGNMTVNEKERHKGGIDKADNKARAIAGNARKKSRGHEPVSDQKSHEYH